MTTLQAGGRLAQSAVLRYACCRRELLDHVIVFNEAHLRRLVREYLGYYHADRIHDGFGKDTPEMRPMEAREAGHCRVAGMPRLGGLHHRYTWRLAA